MSHTIATINEAHETTATTAIDANKLDWAQLDATVRLTLRSPALTSSISLITYKGDSIDDLAQTALMKLFEHLPQFDADKSDIKTYAANHARQAVTDRLRYWSQPKRLLETAPLSLQYEYEYGNTLEDAMPVAFSVFDDYSDVMVENAVDTVNRKLGGKCAFSVLRREFSEVSV